MAAQRLWRSVPSNAGLGVIPSPEDQLRSTFGDAVKQNDLLERKGINITLYWSASSKKKRPFRTQLRRRLWCSVI